MVRLVPMTPAEFTPFLDRLVVEYAEDSARAGRWSPSEAPAEARKQVEQLLPKGLQTPGHFFYHLVAEGSPTPVGAMWLAVEPRGGFVYDIRVDAAHRRRGYAEAAMRAAERVAREHGASRISLHVFGGNTGARRLYQKLGYDETNVMMAKSLSPPA